MKVKVFSAFILFFFIGNLAFGQYVGGSGDGHSYNKLINAVCSPTNVNVYVGGSGDGHSYSKLTNAACSPTNISVYVGGSGDGHSYSKITNVVCSPSNVNPFIGGLADGHGNSKLINVVCSVTNITPFIGGLADGHGSNKLINTTCSVINITPFIGGLADGHGYNGIVNVSRSVCLGIVLPIELLSFNASPDSGKVKATWVTATEINSDYFEVQKTIDGNSYSKVAVVKAAGNSIYNRYYQAYDWLPYPGTSYYRLKQTDLDGSFKYSNDVVVHFDNSPFSLFPNPAKQGEIITVSYNSNYASDNIVLQVNDILGKLLITKTYMASLGANSFTLPIPEISNGVYLIDITSSYFHQVVKLVVTN
jgi:hypothetical protein